MKRSRTYLEKHAGIIALLVLLIFLGWYAYEREMPRTDEEIRTLSANVLAELGVKSGEKVESDVLHRLNTCLVIQVGKEGFDRNCDSLCGRRTCVYAGARFSFPEDPEDSTYQPINCGTGTQEAMFCNCC